VDAVRELCRRRWSVALIAEAVSALTLPAIERLFTLSWSKSNVERLMDECARGVYPGKRQIFSPRRIHSVCKSYGIARRSPTVKKETCTLLDRRRCYQNEQGWGHLLPKLKKGTKTYSGGHILSRRQIEILNAIRDGGPLTRREIIAALSVSGSRPLRSGGRSNLRRLVEDGLLIASHPSPTSPNSVYSLGLEAVKPS
jgi:hypothetical protein